MRFIPSLIFLAQGVSFTFGQNEVRSESCALYVSTQYVTVVETIYPLSASNTMHPGSSSNGESITSVITQTVTQVVTPELTALQTITQVVTETLAPQTVTQVITETLAPQTITQVITEAVTPTPKTIPVLTPIYTNTTMKNSPTISSAKFPVPSSVFSFTNSTTILMTNSTSTSLSYPISTSVTNSTLTSLNNSTSTFLNNSTSTSLKNSTSIPLNNSTSTSLTNSTSTSVTTPNACFDSCALNVISSLGYCSSIFQTTIYPSTVTQTVYTTAFPSNITLSTIVSTETLSETLLFTSSETSTTTTIYESTTALSTTVTDTTVTVTSTTGSTTITAISSAPVKKRQIPRSLSTSSLSIPTITVTPDTVLSSACTDSAAYLSACSCAGVSHVITTLPTPTVTITSVINGTFTFTDNLTTTTQAETSVTTTVISDVGYTSTVDLTATIETTATVTTDVIATTTVTHGPTPNAYCENGGTVDGLTSPCTGEHCLTFTLRIEGETSTIYEGLIYTGPQNVTTASGGTHLCDGRNDGANPSPGGTATTAINSAAGLCGFDFDAIYDSSFQDYFITRISSSAQTSTKYWGGLNNFQYLPVGGCQYEPAAGDEILWAYDAFSANSFLHVEPKVMTLTLGSVGFITVTDGATGNPASGASFNGVPTNSIGQVAYIANQQGTFRYKAIRSGSIRSEAVVITVT